MKSKILIKIYCVILVCGCFTSCDNFVEVDVPNDRIVSETVFNNDEMVISAMNGIYNQLFDSSFSNGGLSSVTVLAGLSSDDLTTIKDNDLILSEFDKNDIFPDNQRNLNLWLSAYNIIYMTNSIIGGLADSTLITNEVRYQIEGEAKFVRALSYFYLVNLYGDVPLLLTTDYRTNTLAPRDPADKVYQQIVSDLKDAVEVLKPNYRDEQRTHVNKYAATALLARVYLYLQNWKEAEKVSSKVISQKNKYEILKNLDLVFLANSREAIWQLSPIGRGDIFIETNDGSNFIIHPRFPVLSSLKLTDYFVNSFQTWDNRLSHWINFNEGLGAYYPYKYKVRESTSTKITEYSMVLRVAEQYLIRAEARTMQENISGAISDLDIIRNRAGLDLISITNPDIKKEKLLNLIINERKKELFTEWGHRWMDLKRTGRADKVLGNENPHWHNTSLLFPIPEIERSKNSNLSQNIGY